MNLILYQEPEKLCPDAPLLCLTVPKQSYKRDSQGGILALGTSLPSLVPPVTSLSQPWFSLCEMGIFCLR